MNKKSVGNSLESFNWDAQANEIDFFGDNAPEGMVVIGDDETQPKEETKEETKTEDEPKENLEKQDEEKQEVLQEAFQDIVTDEEESSSDESKEEKGSEDISHYRSLYTALKSNGIFEDEENEDGEEPEITADFLVEKFDETLENRLSETIQGLPQELRNIIKYVHNGGELSDILSQYSENMNFAEDFDLEEITDQERFVRAVLLEEGQEEELVDSQIEFFKEGGKLKSIAEKLHERWKKDREEAVAEDVKRQEAARKAAIENQKNFKKDITQYISENKNIKGLSIGRADVSNLPDYISSPTVKLQDGRMMTPFYRDLFESMKDKEKLVVLAKLVRNGFDFNDIKKDAVTKQTREVKQDIQRQKKSTREAHKRLIDYLD